MTRVQANIYFFDISSSLLSHYPIYPFSHRFSKRLLELWLSQGSTLTLPSLVNPSREVCKLKYLTGAAPVVYGVPDILTGGGWPQLELTSDKTKTRVKRCLFDDILLFCVRSLKIETNAEVRGVDCGYIIHTSYCFTIGNKALTWLTQYRTCEKSCDDASWTIGLHFYLG